MEQLHKETAAFNPPSPHSSSGVADSLKGTPDTGLTAFSPDGSSAKSSRLLKPLNVGAAGATPIRFPVKGPERNDSSASDKDPFVSDRSAVTTSQLSATASAFHPFPDFVGAPEESDMTQDVDGTVSRPADLSESAVTHCVMLFSPDRDLSLAGATAYLEKLEGLGILSPGVRQVLCRHGRVFVRFNDAWSAATALNNVHSAASDCLATYVPESEWIQHTVTHLARAQVSILAFAISSNSLNSPTAESKIRDLLQTQGELRGYRRISNSHGPSVYTALAEYSSPANAVAAIEILNGREMEGIVVHLSPTSADGTRDPPPSQPRPVESLQPHPPQSDLSYTMQNLSLTRPTHAIQLVNQASPAGLATTHHNDPTGFQMQQPFAMWPIICQTPFQPNMAYVLDNTPQTPGASPSSPSNYQFRSSSFPGGQMLHLNDGLSHPRTMPGCSQSESARRQNAARVNRSPYYNAASHHNHVDVGRIREGTDVRTTIMLRNIPNKVDQAMLKRIVDESSWGKYDFMYLRIDFANDCNVGYAFINFVDPLDIIDFVNARGNQRWNCFKSDKVAEISYATIQGKDCLVQKFRNSSVMLEAAHYRPKLFYTSNGPLPELAGQEEPFPEPDNQSKMKRSCENAEHVGLFTPNAGQHLRDEQRRRRSQYDRGTRLAALEEHDFETTIEPYMHL